MKDTHTSTSCRCRNCLTISSLTFNAVLGGAFDIMRWLCTKYPEDSIEYITTDYLCCLGMTDEIVWCKNIGAPFSEKALRRAATGKHYELAKQLWDMFPENYFPTCDGKTIKAMMREGTIETVEWLRSKGFIIKPDYVSYLLQVEDNVELTKEIVRRGYVKVRKEWIYSALHTPSPKTIRWLFFEQLYDKLTPLDAYNCLSRNNPNAGLSRIEELHCVTSRCIQEQLEADKIIDDIDHEKYDPKRKEIKDILREFIESKIKT